MNSYNSYVVAARRRSREEILKALARQLFYAGLVAYFVYRTILDTMWGSNEVINLLPYFFCSTAILHIAISRLTSLRSLVACGVLFFAAFMVWRNTSYKEVVFAVLLLTACFDAKPNDIVWIHLVTVGALVVASTAASQLGIIEDRLFFDAARGIRHSMGMTYVTKWAAYIAFLVADYLWLRKDKLRWFDFALVLAIAYFTYNMTAGRLELVAMLLLALVALFRRLISKSRLVKGMMALSFPISLVVAFRTALLYGSSQMKYEWLNQLFSGRLRYTYDALCRYPIRPFGSVVFFQGYGTLDFNRYLGYNYVDSFYVQYSILWGWVLILLFCILAAACGVVLDRHRDFDALVMLAFTSAHGIIISMILNFAGIPGFLIVAAATGVDLRSKIADHSNRDSDEASCAC